MFWSLGPSWLALDRSSSEQAVFIRFLQPSKANLDILWYFDFPGKPARESDAGSIPILAGPFLSFNSAAIANDESQEYEEDDFENETEASELSPRSPRTFGWDMLRCSKVSSDKGWDEMGVLKLNAGSGIKIKLWACTWKAANHLPLMLLTNWV